MTDVNFLRSNSERRGDLAKFFGFRGFLMKDQPFLPRNNTDPWHRLIFVATPDRTGSSGTIRLIASKSQSGLGRLTDKDDTQLGNLT